MEEGRGVARWLGGWVAGPDPFHPATPRPCYPVLRGRRGNRFERDWLEGSQLFLVCRHRDRAVYDRLLVGSNSVDHVLRHRLVQVTETDAVFRQTQRLLATRERALDNLLRGQE